MEGEEQADRVYWDCTFLWIDGLRDSIIIMSINNSTKQQYIELNMKQQSEGKAELKVTKLIMLLCVLAGVWILCYYAEGQFPARHIADTYDRVGSNNVTQQAYEYAINFITNNTQPETDFNHRVYLSKKYSISKSAEKQICVILIHRPEEQKWMSSIKTLLAQNYSKAKIYYLNNYEGGQQIYQYLQANSLDKQRIRVIENIPDSDYSKQYEYSKTYCEPNDLVVYMHDDDQLVGQDAFVFINAIFTKNEQLQLLYSSSVIRKQRQLKRHKQTNQRVTYGIGKSYPYPPAIIKQKKYRNYPYLIDGLLVVKKQLLTNLLIADILNSKNKPYQRGGEVALGISLLELAGENILYVPQILLVRSVERQYIAVDEDLKQQMDEIHSRQ